jgi:hypothetical protein
MILYNRKYSRLNRKATPGAFLFPQPLAARNLRNRYPIMRVPQDDSLDDPITKDPEQIVLRLGVVLRKMKELAEKQPGADRQTGKPLEQFEVLSKTWRTLMDRLSMEVENLTLQSSSVADRNDLDMEK